MDNHPVSILKCEARLESRAQTRYKVQSMEMAQCFLSKKLYSKWKFFYVTESKDSLSGIGQQV